MRNIADPGKSDRLCSCILFSIVSRSIYHLRFNGLRCCCWFRCRSLCLVLSLALGVVACSGLLQSRSLSPMKRQGMSIVCRVTWGQCLPASFYQINKERFGVSLAYPLAGVAGIRSWPSWPPSVPSLARIFNVPHRLGNNS